MAEPLPSVVQAEFTAGAAAANELPPPTGMEIAFAGRSNVGKSSLLNSLMGRRNLVRTSSTPGCTRKICFYRATGRDGSVLSLVDLPGYGYAQRSKSEKNEWAELIERYLLGRPTLAAVALLVDVRRGLEAEERDLLEMLEGPSETARLPLRLLLVATKTDRAPRGEVRGLLAKLTRDAGRPVIGYSTKESASAERLWKALKLELGLAAPALSPRRSATASE